MIRKPVAVERPGVARGCIGRPVAVVVVIGPARAVARAVVGPERSARSGRPVVDAIRKYNPIISTRTITQIKPVIPNTHIKV